MQLAEIFVLALASMIWPALIAAVTVALASRQPVKLLASFLAGALLTTVAIGVVVVFLLQGSSLFTGSHRTVGAGVYLVAGGAALFVAQALRRRPRRATVPRLRSPSVRPGRSGRSLVAPPSRSSSESS
jgi:hypothetical protein